MARAACSLPILLSVISLASMRISSMSPARWSISREDSIAAYSVVMSSYLSGM